MTVAYTHTPRPFDTAGLRGARPATATWSWSSRTWPAPRPRVVAEALPTGRTGCSRLGVGRADLRRYGTPADHARWHGLDPAAPAAPSLDLHWLR